MDVAPLHYLPNNPSVQKKSITDFTTDLQLFILILCIEFIFFIFYNSCLQIEEFFPKDQYQVIFYDQLGSYYSDQPDDPSLWTVNRF